MLLRRAGRGTRIGLGRPHAFPILLKFHALRFERRKGVDGGLHPAARCAQLGLASRELSAYIGEFGLELLQPSSRIVGACLRRIEFCTPIDMLAVQPIDVGLESLAAVFVLAHALARFFKADLERSYFLFQRANLHADFAQSLLTLNNSGVRIRITGYTQPILP